MAAANETSPRAAESPQPESVRGSEGYYHLGRRAGGQWSLLDPDGRPFHCRAVNDVSRAPAVADGEPICDSAARLRRWGFNAVGPGGDGTACDDGLPFFATVDFCAAGPILVAPTLRLPDVFAPDWPQRARGRAAAVCGPLAARRELIAWVTDSDLGWAQPNGRARPTLLQLCLSLEPAFAAYHAAWEFVLALHGGRIEALARAWDTPILNKEVVRELTRSETPITTRGYARDEARWTREFARRYFTSTAEAIRIADPNHLMAGCRFQRPVGANVLGECGYPTMDVTMPHWSEVLAGGAAATIESPVLAGDVDWADPEFIGSARATGRGRLSSVERMLRRGRVTLERLLGHPLVVGYGWSAWQDAPGEQPPFARGLVHANGIEAREHTEVLADINARAEKLRRVAPKVLSS